MTYTTNIALFSSVPFSALLLLTLIVCLPGASPCLAEEQAKNTGPAKAVKLSDVMRVNTPEGKRQPQSLDTAIVHFVDARRKISVDLVAAVHVGDKAYYEELNKRFKKYDAVLYELVAERDVVPEKKAAGDKSEHSVLSSIQSSVGRSLKLDFQLEHVDYRAKNFVHADLSPEEFAERLAERGDLLQMLYRTIVLELGKGKDGANEEMQMQGRLLGTLLARDPALQLKRFFAKEMMNQMDDSVYVLGGEGSGDGCGNGDGSALITDRNAAALRVLRQEMRRGKKKLAIFYGGAHLPEFVKSLEGDFQMKQTGVTWIIAWDLTTDRSARKVAASEAR